MGSILLTLEARVLAGGIVTRNCASAAPDADRPSVYRPKRIDRMPQIINGSRKQSFFSMIELRVHALCYRHTVVKNIIDCLRKSTHYYHLNLIFETLKGGIRSSNYLFCCGCTTVILHT
jgi:hypothetical protein